jgi:alkylation response protein AidB-like acyl-CoA dehydrogenase
MGDAEIERDWQLVVEIKALMRAEDLVIHYSSHGNVFLGFLLNGVRHFGSLGEHASYHFVSGMMEGATSARDGQRSVVVSTNSPGIVVERDWDAVGMRHRESLDQV